MLTRSRAPISIACCVDAFHAASARLTWQVVAATAAIAAALIVWSMYEFAFDTAFPEEGEPVSAMTTFISAVIIDSVMAFSMMFMTFAADELVVRGAPRRLAYPLAVIVGSAIAALVQRGIHLWLGLQSRYDGVGTPHDISMMQPAVVFFEYLTWGSIVVFIYVNRRTALAASARMNLAQVEQAWARRRTLQSRLQALQARVEPQFLFNTLAKVRILYDVDRHSGSQLLEDLIVYLRAALPQLRDSTSTLERELKLVNAYLSIMRVHTGDRLAFATDDSRALAGSAARLPPMILLPIVDHVLSLALGERTARRELRIVSAIVSGRLRIEISLTGASPAARGSRDVLSDIRERLHALYGDAAELAYESANVMGARVVMEIPHEAADGDHR
jgi:hypothetical protein